MKFSEQILSRLEVDFKTYDLNIVEQRDNYLRLKNIFVIIIIAHNQLEKSNVIWLGKNVEKPDLVEIDNQVLELFFQSNLNLSEVVIEIFLDNLVMFFKNDLKNILLGNMPTIDNLEKFDLERSRKYTQDLLRKQDIVSMDRAWSNEKYDEFIKLMDKTDKSQLPASYSLKYKIAFKKTGK